MNSQAERAGGSPVVDRNCQPAAPADLKTRVLWRPSGVPGITQYVPSGTYFGIAKVRRKQVRVNLGPNLRKAARAFKARKHQLRVRVTVERTETALASKLWSHYASQYRIEIQSRVDLADASKAYLLQRLKAIEATWPDAGRYRAAEPKPAPSLCEMEVTELTKESLSAWAAGYASNYSHTAYNNSVTVLQAVLGKAVDAGVLIENPAAHLARVGEPEQAMKWLPSPEQWDGILDRMRTFGRGGCRRAADLAELICYTGCRLSEVRRIRWTDVDFKAKTLVIHGSKGRKKRSQNRLRVIPLHSRLEGLLQRLRSQQLMGFAQTEFVAPARECLGTLQRACLQVGLLALKHHDLRHIFATWCVERGVDIPTIADMLGHRDGGRLLLRRYRHLRIEHLQAVGAKLNF